VIHQHTEFIYAIKAYRQLHHMTKNINPLASPPLLSNNLLDVMRSEWP